MENLRLKYGDVELEIQDGYTISKSSGSVTYSDLVCGWNENITELPEKYQEVKIVNIDNNKVKAYGYVDSYDFGELRETDVERDINISLLTPMKITTLRTVIANGTYNLIDLLQNIIIAPLIYDGFELQTLEITDHQVTVNFTIETIEYCLNNLSNKFNFWWFIDENKKIYISDIEILKNNEPVYVYDDNNRIPGLEYIKPITSSDNYANVVNFKNLRTYQYSFFVVTDGVITEKMTPLLKERATNIVAGGEILFEHPVDIKKENIIRCCDTWLLTTISNRYALDMHVAYTDNSYSSVSIYVDENDEYHVTNNITENTENTDVEFTMIKDPFFSNLLIGVRYNGNKTIKDITWLNSVTALVWNTNKFYNDKGILGKKGKISNTGIIETTVDMNGSWKTMPEVAEIAKTYLNRNSLNYANELEIRLDENVLKVGNTIKINKFGINSEYVITDIKEICKNKECEYVVKAQSENAIGNYVDVFRRENGQQDDGRNYKIYVTHYNTDEIVQTTEVLV